RRGRGARSGPRMGSGRVVVEGTKLGEHSGEGGRGRPRRRRRRRRRRGGGGRRVLLEERGGKGRARRSDRRVGDGRRRGRRRMAGERQTLTGRRRLGGGPGRRVGGGRRLQVHEVEDDEDLAVGVVGHPDADEPVGRIDEILVV